MNGSDVQKSIFPVPSLSTSQTTKAAFIRQKQCSDTGLLGNIFSSSNYFMLTPDQSPHLLFCYQDVFGQVHPIHFLNSRALGIGVGRGQSPSKERENIFGFSAGSRREVAGSEPTSGSPQNMDGAHLFVGELSSDGCLELLLEHAQDVSMWVAVEICSASSVKV